MINIKNFTTAIVLATASIASTTVLAQQNSNMDMKSVEMTSGEVRKIDKEVQTITLKHGAIKNMDMPPMTMVFKVLDPALLEKVKAGDKVNFRAEKRDRAMVVTEIEVTP